MRNCLISFLIALLRTAAQCEIMFEVSQLYFFHQLHVSYGVTVCTSEMWQLKAPSDSFCLGSMLKRNTLQWRYMTNITDQTVGGKFNSQHSYLLHFLHISRQTDPKNLLLLQNDVNAVTPLPSFALNSLRPRFLFLRPAALHALHTQSYEHTYSMKAHVKGLTLTLQVTYYRRWSD